MDSFYNSVRVFQGRGCLRELPSVCKKALKDDLSAIILILVWDKSVLEQKGIQKLQEEFPNTLVEECSVSNPEIEDLFGLYQKFYRKKVDLIIAVGGGSVMDLGKSLCMIHDEEIESAEELRNIIAEKRYRKSSLQWIGVPTTSGTGSEVTCWATVWDMENLKKSSIETTENYAYAAFADSRLTENLPIKLAVSSALDAACHAAESYWAKSTNSISQMYALKAIHLIFSALPALVERRDPILTSEILSRASLVAGLAFSNTHTTACHSISYPLTMLFRIPHGVAVALLLGGVFKLNQSKIEELPELLESFGVKSVDDIQPLMEGFLTAAGFEIRLSKWGATDATLEEAAEKSMTKGRADNNPVPLDKETVLKILNNIKG